ncbi:transcription factor bHLH128 isoform X2 [Lactuca sativa]|uniref:transcription factor bHLH128 isoform X2 n=1 Tax=Lactuca sativa TaxID=4236 RepID=UPI000CB6B279|nr:transcription factor bHLH128 isoform X2 [Lactuca sativa]
MYPTSNSSSASQTSGGDPNNINGSNVNGGGGGAQQGLARYRSAPVSFLTTTVDSVINGQTQHTTVGNHNMVGGGGTPTRFFSPPDSTSSQLSTGDRLQTTSFRLNEFATAFNGLKDGRGSRLSSQLSFTGTSSFSQISQENDIANSLMFSNSSHNKRAKLDINGLNVMDSELNFGLSESALEAATMEKMMDLPHDSVPCKIRAKRGCATHPRSIAERERRTRISGKLKKLQDLVPNMDKQTSYSDMLDLAVQHIKGLQTHVQNLNNELQNCSCGCKPK